MDGFRGPRKGRSEPMVLSEKTLYSLGRRCVYIFNRRKAKKEIPDNNALAESVIGLYKTEVINRRGPWRTLEVVELATLEWVDWFNHRRLLNPIGYVPPVECEEQYYRILKLELKRHRGAYFRGYG